MADGMTVPGIQASFGLDTTELDSALSKVRSGMDSAAEKIRAAQKELMAGSMSAVEFAEAVRQAEAESSLLEKTAENLANRIQAQKSAFSESISFASSWTSAIKEGSKAASDYAQQLQDMAALQAHLGQMEYRQRAHDTEIQAAQEMLELQAALAAMEQRTAAESVEAEQARVRGLQQGRDAVKQVTAAIDEENAALQRIAKADAGVDFIDKLAAGMSKARVENETAAPMMMRSADAIRQQADAMKAGDTFTVQYTTSMRNMGAESERVMRRTQSLAMGLMQVGYIVDDIQYGFQGVVNNLSPLTMNIGMALGATGPQAAAAAAGVQIFGVAAYQAYQHWDDLMHSMGTGHIITEAQEMERLAKATEKTADEAKRLRDYKAVESEVKKQQGMRPDAEEKSTKKFDEAIAEGDYDTVVKGLVQTRGAQLENFTGVKESKKNVDDLKKKLAEADKANPDFVPLTHSDEFVRDYRENLKKQLRKQLEAAEKKLESDKTKAAQQFLGEAARNEGGRREELMSSMEANPNAFGPHSPAILDKLKQSTPEKIKEQERKKRTARIAKNHEEYTQRQIREQEHEDQELARQRRENLKAAKDAIPGVEDRTKRRIREGGSQYDALKKELMGLGFGEEDAAQAAEQINHEASNKVTAENQDPEFQRRQRHAARQRGEEAVPGLGKMAQNMELQGIAQGMKPEQIWKSVTGRIRKALSDAGLKGDELNNATSEIATQADRDLKKEVVKEALKEPEIRHSEVFDAGEINRRVQQSVGGDPHKKAEGQREQMIKYLATMAQANGNVLQLKIDE